MLRGILTIITKKFFATVQNKLYYAVHEHTAAELIYERVDNEKPHVGMTNFKEDYVTIDDIKIAKNYLTEIELQSDFDLMMKSLPNNKEN